ncbi:MULTISPECIES: hypothetical protein [unclassified Mesorhizobium]|uniref:hypothetical protein n=1 Tax=unclassified Mesorhizobium TaxID=325217 RepID=UPI000BAFDBC0|nr:MULTISPECIES: hypothetical protein [unclassified Mesorhizobium]TGT56832.1 hypothetical protein EN813_041150 [Mesorhizobium sp. M00.F.Ca.ET.170.01.1.1]AZO08599.1 hypothetical protein EJ074_05255 [Mesorhizobium sp. M3A.F.Ca.ET.080.04.2.1]PBB85479.1 hypothetical protein CK216_17640 [Mesorhizobium sp. WSM3876]RWB71716.1 MAG: hypothetical protein EOQ49_14465 [Mesorhizobium sp.]RWB85032.1 MAG: hypothetical protein EOQ52_22445 [Mesorhizobium sp.]
MKRVVLAAVIGLLSALPAMAQADEEPMHKQTQNCQAKPDPNDPQQKLKQQADTDELSQQLNDCGGVLKPPPTGDKNATPPPPTGSEMPIIKPGDVPPQTAK